MVLSKLEELYSAITKLAFYAKKHKQISNSILNEAQQAAKRGGAQNLNAQIKSKDGREWLIIDITHNDSVIRKHLAQDAERILGIQRLRPIFCIVSGSIVTIEGALPT